MRTALAAAPTCRALDSSVPNPPEPAADDSDSYVGLSVETARLQAAENGWRLVREVTGESPVVTAEFRPDRINFHVRDDHVIRCWFH